MCIAVMACAAAGSLFWLKGRELSAPDWLRDAIEARLVSELPEIDIELGDLVGGVGDDWRPSFFVRNVEVSTAAGVEIVSFSNVELSLDKPALLQGRLRPNSLNVDGVFVTMRRSPEGAISLSAGSGEGAARREARSLAQLVGELDGFLLRPALVELTSMDVRAVTLRYEDERAGRAWTADGGRMRLTRDGVDLAIAVDVAILGGGAQVATLSANYSGEIGTVGSDFGFTIKDLDARDIASQGAAFSWLAAVEAPISGALRGGVTQEGTFNPLSATLQIGAGVIQPNAIASPIPITGARSYFTYEPETQSFQFDELSVESKWGSGRLEGQATLGGQRNGQLEELIGQFTLAELNLSPANFYPEPVVVDRAQMDFRLQLAPFSLQIGRLDVTDLGKTLSGQGRVSAGPEGWEIALDAEMPDAFAPERLLELWPDKVALKTRKWIAENIYDGTITNASGAVRMKQGGAPRTYLAFDFEDADVRYVKTLPPVLNGKGHASLVDNRFVVVLDEGGVMASQGGFVDAAGSSFIIPDVKIKPDPPAVVRLTTTSSVTSVLSLLDQPPLQVMQKADIPVSVAKGIARLQGTLALILKKKTPVSEITFDVIGDIEAVRSDDLVKDRTLVAERLSLVGSENQIAVSGEGRIDGVAADVRWVQPLDLETPGASLPSQVTGTVEITPEALAAFKVDLPPGTVRGTTQAQITLDIEKGLPPRFSLNSDLRGAAVSLPPIGWSKAQSTAGNLAIDMTLGPSPKIDEITLSAPGLTATGRLDLTADGQLDRLRLDRAQVGGWFDAPVDLVGRGAGQPVGVVVRGGTLDLRRANFGQPSGDNTENTPLTVSLDRLQVSDTIAITNLEGAFTTAGGVAGSFRGAVNGAAAVQGKLSPQNGRSAISLTAANAGQVFAAAGLLKQARDGRMQPQLQPVGSDGAYDGKLRVVDTSITDAPTMAALLNSISIVGLVNELNGDGIYFSEINADFRLTPSRITIRDASAVGSSMGISMDGVFVPQSGQLQLQGVITPVYMLNGIASFLTRKGEGLLGFNYAISGTAKQPDVFVNPLTVLAPGMLRDLFRRAKPEVPLEDGETRPPPEPPRKRVVTRGEDR